MRFVTASLGGERFIGMMDEGVKKVYNLSLAASEMKIGYPESLLEGIERGEDFLHATNVLLEKLRSGDPHRFTYDISHPDLCLLAPIPSPRKNILCVGKNYKDHAIEMGSIDDIPKHIMMFTKAPTTVIGHQERILAHSDVTSELDYEGELAVVIGKRGIGIPAEEAYDYVFGYTIINDVTARDLQARHKQFFLGKSLDSSCPMGPYLVHRSAIQNPESLAIETKVNGEIRQRANTKDFIFSIPEIISTISKGMTLEPGDIIATGTPAGVGKGFNPPKFLKTGDLIEITVEGIGTLRNEVY
ncbi:fumarylacetoacetate hydrolase family protein [Fictibacillus sp. Mic-4]|uniref:fumarylacetoacetate hydrolase family protein n=1 Tax=Fictibacillus TaxID=1329200 RepID=UPI0004289CF5|nr:fumarylacetoacetate hydrolase family protein [Fictibacillus gelatini]